MWAAIGIVVLSATATMQAPSWPYKLEWEHDGRWVTHFELCVDSACQPLTASRAEGARTWSAALPVLAQGFHTLVVSACNNSLCTAGTPSLSVDVQPGPVIAPPGTPPPTTPPPTTPPSRKAPPRRPPKK